MANNLTDEAELGLLTVLTGGSYTVTTPLKLKLVTALGSESAAGTEVSGGSYAAPTITMGTPSAGQVANTNAPSVTNMPAATVIGVEVWDSSGTPKRLFWSKTGEFTSRTFQLGDTATIAVGAVVFSLD